MRDRAWSFFQEQGNPDFRAVWEAGYPKDSRLPGACVRWSLHPTIPTSVVWDSRLHQKEHLGPRLLTGTGLKAVTQVLRMALGCCLREATAWVLVQEGGWQGD
jgi:hypothetical protein